MGNHYKSTDNKIHKGEFPGAS